MWFVGLLSLLNAVLNNDTVVNVYRFDIGGLPVNIFDVLLVVGCLGALLRARDSAHFIKTERIHPIVLGCFVLFGFATVGGLIGATYNGASPREVITTLRNFLAAPVALYLAYFLTGTFHASRKYLYWLIGAGVGASLMIVLFFTTKAETRMIGQDITTIRAIFYVSSYAGLAACLLFYSMAAGLRLLPTITGVLLLGLCLVGQCGTLSRSDWLALATGLAAAIIMLPKEARMQSIVRLCLAGPVLVLSMYAGLYAASRVAGKDMFGKMETRVMSMVPGYNPGESNKAWRSRLPGTFRELRKFVTTPIIGGGFGIDDTAEMGGYSGLRHNTWTSTLAETGLLGFSAFALLTFGMGLVGWRMVADQTDKTTVLIGAMGFVTCAYYFMWGMSTMTFNQVRPGLVLFVMAGVVLRTRAMQLEYKKQADEEQVYLELSGTSTAIAANSMFYSGQYTSSGNW